MFMVEAIFLKNVSAVIPKNNFQVLEGFTLVITQIALPFP